MRLSILLGGWHRRTLHNFLYFLPGWTTRGGRSVFALPVLRTFSAIEAPVAQVGAGPPSDQRGSPAEPEQGNESPGDAAGNGAAGCFDGRAPLAGTDGWCEVGGG